MTPHALSRIWNPWSVCKFERLCLSSLFCLQAAGGGHLADLEREIARTATSVDVLVALTLQYGPDPSMWP